MTLSLLSGWPAGKLRENGKKDQLHVSLEMMKDTPKNYQIALKNPRRQYFSMFVSYNAHRTRVLFSVVLLILVYPSVFLPPFCPVKI